MNRKSFIKKASMGGLGIMSLSVFANCIAKGSTPLMPVLFIGHGNPAYVIQPNSFTKSWEKIAGTMPKPKAILSISAHWYINDTKVTAMPNPRTIYDFYGFPEEMYQIRYDAPGAEDFAAETATIVDLAQITMDHEWGLDHGTWCVLKYMYPKADIPVFQLSIDHRKNGEWHFALANQLKALRRKGVLIMGSGNIVHNLGQSFTKYHDFVPEFDAYYKGQVRKRDFKSLAQFEKLRGAAQLAIPTPDHYLPSLYSLGLAEDNEEITFFNEEVIPGGISMSSFLIS